MPKPRGTRARFVEEDVRRLTSRWTTPAIKLPSAFGHVAAEPHTSVARPVLSPRRPGNVGCVTRCPAHRCGSVAGTIGVASFGRGATRVAGGEPAPASTPARLGHLLAPRDSRRPGSPCPRPGTEKRQTGDLDPVGRLIGGEGAQGPRPPSARGRRLMSGEGLVRRAISAGADAIVTAPPRSR